jgi:hypothetical protein
MAKIKLTEDQEKYIASLTDASPEEVRKHVELINKKMSSDDGNTLQNRKKLDQKLKVFTNEFNATCEFDKSTKDWTLETKELIDFLVMRWNTWCAENALQTFGPVFLAEIRVSLAVKLKDRRFRLDIFQEKFKQVQAETVAEAYEKMKGVKR